MLKQSCSNLHSHSENQRVRLATSDSSSFEFWNGHPSVSLLSLWPVTTTLPLTHPITNTPAHPIIHHPPTKQPNPPPNHPTPTPPHSLTKPFRESVSYIACTWIKTERTWSINIFHHTGLQWKPYNYDRCADMNLACRHCGRLEDLVGYLLCTM